MAADQPTLGKLLRGLRTRNVGSTLAFAPPLSISADEVDDIVQILGSVLDTVAS